MFKKGDKVKRINGETFSNGERVLTVKSITPSLWDDIGKTVHLQETKTWLDENELELAESVEPSRVSARVMGAIELLEEEISSLQSKTTALKASLDHLKGVK